MAPVDTALCCRPNAIPFQGLQACSSPQCCWLAIFDLDNTVNQTETPTTCMWKQLILEVKCTYRLNYMQDCLNSFMCKYIHGCLSSELALEIISHWHRSCTYNAQKGNKETLPTCILNPSFWSALSTSDNIWCKRLWFYILSEQSRISTNNYTYPCSSSLDNSAILTLSTTALRSK